MQTATIQFNKYNYKIHKKIVDIVKPKILHKLKSYNQPHYKIRGYIPDNLKSFDSQNFNDSSLDGKSLLLSVPVSKIRTLTDDDEDLKRYQRPINIDNCIKYINDDLTNESAGFSYDYCGVIEGTLSYDEDENEWYVFVVVGQHRTAMAYLVGGESIELPVKVFIPNRSKSIEERLTEEARRHFVDATKRTGQNQVDKISSALFSADKDTQELIKFYDSCKVGIGTLLPYEKKCDSWSDIQSAIKEYGVENVRRCMTAVAKYTTNKKIPAKVITSLAQLCHVFESRVENFEKLNSLDFVDTITKYVFVLRKPKVVAIDFFTKHSGKHKGTEYIVATWISFVNEMFVWNEDYKRENKAQNWMTRRSPEWKEFLDENVAEPFHEPYNQKIEMVVI
jgi:hypothetical protein